jgi:hypothetical protein
MPVRRLRPRGLLAKLDFNTGPLLYWAFLRMMFPVAESLGDLNYRRNGATALVVTPKPAIRGHLKTGHRESGRTTVVITRPMVDGQGPMLAASERPEGAIPSASAGCVNEANRRRTCGNVGIADAISKRGGKVGKPAFGFPGFPGRVISIRSLRCADCGLHAPTSRTAFQHVTVMQQPVKHRTDRRSVAEQFPPVLDGTIRCQ